jgi:hypothetical protein
MSEMLKNWKLLFISCALVIGGLGGSALARGGGGRGAMVKKFDENGDGKLDDAERAKLKAARDARKAKRKAEALARYDADKNGVLDPGERSTMRSDRAAERFKKLDTDGDGKISKDEFAAGAKHKGGRGHRP